MSRIRARIDHPEDIKFLLIVSSAPARTLEGKLSDLQAGLALPIRYANASALAALRRALPAQVPMDPLREAIVGCRTCVLPDVFWHPVAAHYNSYAKQRAALTKVLIEQAAATGDQ